MAPLTWRNVDAPNFSPAASFLKIASDGFGQGFGSFGDALMEARDRQKMNRSAELIPDLAGIKSEADLDQLLSGLDGKINPRDMTPELQKALLGLRSTAMGYDASRAAQARAGAAAARAAATAKTEAERRAAWGEVGLAMLNDRNSASFAGHTGQIPESNASSAAPPSMFERALAAIPGGSRVQGALDAFLGKEAAPEPQPTPPGWSTLMDNVPPETLKLLMQSSDDIGNLLTYGDKTWDAYTSAAKASDEDRGRDADYFQSQEEIRINGMATGLLNKTLSQAYDPTEVPALLQNRGAEPAVIAAALEKLKNTDTAGILTPSARNLPTFEKKTDAETAAAGYTQEQRAYLASNDTVRINQTAQEIYTSGEKEPALQLTERLNLTDNSRGYTVQAMNTVRRALNQEGVPVNDAVVATLLEETVRRGRWGLPFDGETAREVFLDPDAAIELGKRTLNPESMRLANEFSASAQGNLNEVERLQGQVDRLTNEIALDRSRGQDTSEKEDRVSKLYGEMLKLDASRGVAGRPDPKPTQDRPSPVSPAAVSAPSPADLPGSYLGGAKTVADRVTTAMDALTGDPVAKAQYLEQAVNQSVGMPAPQIREAAIESARELLIQQKGLPADRVAQMPVTGLARAVAELAESTSDPLARKAGIILVQTILDTNR